jgi:hypothetical protein
MPARSFPGLGRSRGFGVRRHPHWVERSNHGSQICGFCWGSEKAQRLYGAKESKESGRTNTETKTGGTVTMNSRPRIRDQNPLTESCFSKVLRVHTSGTWGSHASSGMLLEAPYSIKPMSLRPVRGGSPTSRIDEQNISLKANVDANATASTRR